MAEKQVQRGTTSPKYSLEETIDFLKTVDKKFAASPFDATSFAEAFGHSPKSSAVGIKIGALTHFGLLGRHGNAYKVSDLTGAILRPRTPEEKADALVEAARNPSLYQRLFSDYAGQRLPEMLSNILVRTYGVAMSNADDVVETFKKTAEFAGLLVHGILYAEAVASGESHEDTVSKTVDEDDVVQPYSPAGGEEVTRSTGQSMPLTSAPAGFRKCEIPVSHDRDVIIYLPQPCKKKDLDRIIKWIEFSEEILTESGEEVGIED